MPSLEIRIIYLKPLKQFSECSYDDYRLGYAIFSVKLKNFDSFGPESLLTRVLACFDGCLTVEKVIQKFPLDLQEYGVDIIVWLMR